MHDLLDLLGLVNEAPSWRRPWLNVLFWIAVGLMAAITLAYYGLRLSQYLTGWPAS